MSNFWGWFISIITVVNIFGCLWLIRWTSKKAPGEEDTTGHVWDGDLKELNNPLPRWWLWTFYLTIIWALGYTIAYPAWPMISGATSGVLGYSSRADVAAEIDAAAAANAPLDARIESLDLAAIASDAEVGHFASSGGAAVYRTFCTQCHGAGAGGAPGFPNRKLACLGVAPEIQGPLEHHIGVHKLRHAHAGADDIEDLFLSDGEFGHWENTIGRALRRLMNI